MQRRAECFKKFGSHLDMPLITPADALRPLIGPGVKILDFGAGAHKPFEKIIAATGAEYFSMDADPDGSFHFRTFRDVPEALLFDVVISNQALEHMTVDAAFAVVESIFGVLKSGGRFIATVPNSAHPVRQRDCTHVTPWPTNDLYCLLSSAGFDVTVMARYNKAPLTSNPLKRWIVMTVCREFRVDWCDSVLAVGRKP
jgi:SAM-dependent methyltransferase